MPRTVIVSGGFDPLHSGHIAYLQAAAKLGDRQQRLVASKSLKAARTSSGTSCLSRR